MGNLPLVGRNPSGEKVYCLDSCLRKSDTYFHRVKKNYKLSAGIGE